MSGSIALDFIVAGGSRYGMGHVVRSSTLAAAAEARGLPTRVFLAGDRAAETRWRASCPGSILASWSAWRARESAPLTVFDHPFIKSRWLAACRRDRTRTIVLDDSRTIGRARLTINPALHHAPDPETDLPAEDVLEDDPACLTLRGPRYAILGPAHLATVAPPLAERRTLLLSLGGADPHAAAPRLAPILARVLDDPTLASSVEERRVVLGPAFPDPDQRVAGELVRGGWRVERALEPAAMAQRMAQARLAVVGFGTSLCELAWHGTPHLSLTHHAHDETWARLLEERGIGAWLGAAYALDPDRVADRFARALRDTPWQQASAQRARAALEGGRGCERILDRLAMIAREVLARPARSGGRSRQRDRAPL